MSQISHDKSLRDSITDRLEKFDRNNANQTLPTPLTPAAVVIGVSAHSATGAGCILLTRRSSQLRKHAGQFALPGGKVDNDESIIDAALRELDEELNLKPDRDSVMGTLDDMPTQSGFTITPVVVWLDTTSNLHANADEVAEVYEIPLSELVSLAADLSHDDNYPTLDPAADLTENSNSADTEVMSLYLPSVGTTVYSPTAAMIYQFKEVALLGKNTRVAHFGQPRFAWR